SYAEPGAARVRRNRPARRSRTLELRTIGAFRGDGCSGPERGARTARTGDRARDRARVSQRDERGGGVPPRADPGHAAGGWQFQLGVPAGSGRAGLAQAGVRAELAAVVGALPGATPDPRGPWPNGPRRAGGPRDRGGGRVRGSRVARMVGAGARAGVHLADRAAAARARRDGGRAELLLRASAPVQRGGERAPRADREPARRGGGARAARGGPPGGECAAEAAEPGAGGAGRGRGA